MKTPAHKGVKRSFSLRSDRQIRQVLDRGALMRGRYFLVRTLALGAIDPPVQNDGPLLAVVISRKKEKRATARNRMKRQLREIFRLQKHVLPQNAACVIIASRVSKQITYRELERDFLETMQKGMQ